MGGQDVRVDLTREALLDARQAGELIGVKASTVAAAADAGGVGGGAVRPRSSGLRVCSRSARCGGCRGTIWT
jgi:hypothetical protein